MKLAKATELLRVTLDQQGRVAVNGQAYGDGDILRGSDSDGFIRRVTFLTPAAPRLFMALDETVADAGANRTQYKWAPLPSNAAFHIHLGPEQKVYASAEQGGGIVSFGVVVEFLLLEG
jgi:hypothetical protein